MEGTYTNQRDISKDYSSGKLLGAYRLVKGKDPKLPLVYKSHFYRVQYPNMGKQNPPPVPGGIYFRY